MPLQNIHFPRTALRRTQSKTFVHRTLRLPWRFDATQIFAAKNPLPSPDVDLATARTVRSIASMRTRGYGAARDFRVEPGLALQGFDHPLAKILLQSSWLTPGGHL